MNQNRNQHRDPARREGPSGVTTQVIYVHCAVIQPRSSELAQFRASFTHKCHILNFRMGSHHFLAEQMKEQRNEGGAAGAIEQVGPPCTPWRRAAPLVRFRIPVPSASCFGATTKNLLDRAGARSSGRVGHDPQELILALTIPRGQLLFGFPGLCEGEGSKRGFLVAHPQTQFLVVGGRSLRRRPCRIVRAHGRSGRAVTIAPLSSQSRGIRVSW